MKVKQLKGDQWRIFWSRFFLPFFFSSNSIISLISYHKSDTLLLASINLSLNSFASGKIEVIIFLSNKIHFVRFYGLGLSAPLCIEGSEFEVSPTDKILPFFRRFSQNCRKRLLTASCLFVYLSLCLHLCVCPSFRPHGTTGLLLNTFSLIFLFEDLSKICREN